MISVNWDTGVVNVPQSYLTFVSGTLYSLDTDRFRLDLKALEASEAGMPFLDTHQHNTEITIAGVTYARFVEMINSYTVEFEDGQYAVRLDGSNNNIFDEGVIVRNQVSVISTNSAGLVRVDVPGKPTEAHIGASFDDTNDLLYLTVWLERLGNTVASPTSCTVEWYTQTGSLLFTETDTDPDPQGVFYITRLQSLEGDHAYYAEVSVTDATGTITTTRGVPTTA